MKVEAYVADWQDVASMEVEVEKMEELLITIPIMLESQHSEQEIMQIYTRAGICGAFDGSDGEGRVLWPVRWPRR